MNLSEWLQSIGMEQYMPVFESNQLSFDNLDAVTEADLESLGVAMGHRKTILKEIQMLMAKEITNEALAQKTSAEECVRRFLARTRAFSVVGWGIVLAIYAVLSPDAAGMGPWGVSAMGLFGFFGGVVLGLIIWMLTYLYMLPAVYAFKRRNRFRWAIAVANVFAGVTVIGWIILLLLGLKKIDGGAAIALAVFTESR